MRAHKNKSCCEWDLFCYIKIMQKTFHRGERYSYSISSDGKVKNQNTAHAIALGRHKSVVNASAYRIMRFSADELSPMLS